MTGQPKSRSKPLTPAPCNTRPGGIKFPISILYYPALIRDAEQQRNKVEGVRINAAKTALLK
jgi:hypothetical protein